MFKKIKEVGERYLENIKDNMFMLFPRISPAWVEALFIALIFFSIFGVFKACASLEDRLDSFIGKQTPVVEQVEEEPTLAQFPLRPFISYSPEALTSLSGSYVRGAYELDISYSLYDLKFIKKFINLEDLQHLNPKYTLGVSNLLSNERRLSLSVDVFISFIQGGKIFSRVSTYTGISDLILDSPLSKLRGHFAIYYTKTFYRKILAKDVMNFYLGIVSNTTQITDFKKGLLAVKNLVPTKENLTFGIFYNPRLGSNNSFSLDFSLEAMKISLNRRF